MTQGHSRRIFVSHGALTGTAIGLAGIFDAKQAPAFIRHPKERPVAEWGLQFGDIGETQALVWCRADRAALMEVEWSTFTNFRRSHFGGSTVVTDRGDFIGRVELCDLPAGAEIFVKVTFKASGSRRASSQSVFGRFMTAPRRARRIRFVWGGDTAGQGWGIDLEKGGMNLYETMRQVEPQFFLHSGDTIYADGPMLPEVTDSTGQVIWRNAYLDVIPEKLKVAETLNEFRRNHLYNRMDENVRNFTAEVPQIWQWDDHETTNNWSPSKVLDSRYTIVTDIETLSRNARRAFLEHAPMSFGQGDSFGRIYRKVSYGPDLDIFVLDMRTYRAGNSCNVQGEPGPETAFMGQEQIDWLKRELRSSRATWKIVAADMPIGLVVGDGTDPESGCARGENSSNGDGPVLGREFEIAEILRFIKRRHIKNTVWLTADVHYAAAHYYDPSVAQFQDFEPFWEFVSGPLHAGTFGPSRLDNTFGPTVLYQIAPPAGQSNVPPSAGMQYFGQVDIDPHSKTMTVSLKDPSGTAIYSQDLQAE